MKLIVLPDVHGRVDKLKAYLDLLAEVDLIVLAGDLTNGDLEDAKFVLDTIAEKNPNILTIPGNMDTQDIVDYTETLGYNIHGKYRVIDDLLFVGIGGALPFAGAYVYSENQLADLMQSAIKDAPDLPQILICHQPPINTVNDRLSNGQQVGSQSVRDYIEKYQPLICFTGHIHEAIGMDKIGNTHICNPGPVWKAYAYAEVKGDAIKTLEIRSR